jgi:hypothetical protein
MENMDEVNEIMLEHLKLLAEAAEDCEDKNLGIITTAMIETAAFLHGTQESTVVKTPF